MNCIVFCCVIVLCQSAAAKKRGTASNSNETSEVGPASKHARLDQQPDGSDDDHLGN